MKFTDGFWQMRPGVTALYAQEAYDLEQRENSLVVSAPTKVFQPVETVSIHSVSSRIVTQGTPQR